MAGFYGGFVGEVKGAYSSEEHRDETRSVKTYSTSASVLQLIWTAKKRFQIEREQMKLTENAKLMANCIVSEKDAEKREESQSAPFHGNFPESRPCWCSNAWWSAF